MPHWGSRPASPQLDHYPTDLTRDVTPIPCHSHNDYWRRVPLFEALHYGCTSVEADVWLLDKPNSNELFVGHSKSSLTPSRTLNSMYVAPILEILDHANPKTGFTNKRKTETPNGVFDTEPTQSLVLLIDFKTSGADLLPVVYAALQPLREKGYLTYWDAEAGKRVSGPVTIVLTGNAPFDLLTPNKTYTDLFFDAPLDLLSQNNVSSSPSSLRTTPKRRDEGQGHTGIPTAPSSSSFNISNSYYASTSLTKSIGRVWPFTSFSETQMAKIREQISDAKAQGLIPRYWSTPGWPVSTRNYVWRTLLQLETGMLNVDDLEAAARLDWE
jgi:hypothetical protein